MNGLFEDVTAELPLNLEKGDEAGVGRAEVRQTDEILNTETLESITCPRAGGDQRELLAEDFHTWPQ